MECILERTPPKHRSTILALKDKKGQTAFHISKANKNNLKNVSADIPKNILTCMTGVAGSGKSSLMEVFLETTKANNEGDKIIIIDP